MSGKYSIHLVPEESQRRVLEDIVGALAGQFHGPHFTPHVTLMWGHPQEDLAQQKDLIQRMNDISLRWGPLAVPVRGVTYGQTYTNTLFLKLTATEGLLKLQAAIAAFFRPNSQYTFKPHLSLLYAELDNDMKVRLAEQTRPPLSTLILTEFRTNATPDKFENKTDIEAERCVSSGVMLRGKIPADE